MFSGILTNLIVVYAIYFENDILSSGLNSQYNYKAEGEGRTLYL
jgi:hypothetical protein